MPRTPKHTSLLWALAALAALLSSSSSSSSSRLVGGAMACSPAGMEVTKVSAAFKPADSSAYSLMDVKEHFDNMNAVNYLPNTGSTFTCVDARGDESHLSTPGGDYAELAEAAYMFFKQIGIKPNATSVGYIFRTFMDKVATPRRPFYFHTDESKLSELFQGVGADGVKPKPVVFPSVQPSDPKQAEIWYKNLAKPENQGCGHVRLMLYKYKEYGLASPFVAEELIKQFFLYWWPTPIGSPQRSKVMFSIKRGPLAGKAVAIIVNEGPACKDKTPSAMAAYRGSSLFVYHQAAAADFRSKVLAPMFADIAAQTKFWGKQIKFDMAGYINRTEKLAATQLGYTLENLPPADSVGLFKVAFKTVDTPAGGAGKTGGGATGIVDERGRPAAVAASAAAKPASGAAGKPSAAASPQAAAPAKQAPAAASG